MTIVDAFQANLLSPAVLFFVLGIIASLTKSDLKFPEPLYVGMNHFTCWSPSGSKVAWPLAADAGPGQRCGCQR